MYERGSEDLIEIITIKIKILCKRDSNPHVFNVLAGLTQFLNIDKNFLQNIKLILLLCLKYYNRHA